MPHSTMRIAAFAAVVATPLSAQQTVVLPERTNALTDRPQDVFSVGKAEGRSWELLSNVTGLAFDAQNQLYVLDSGNFRVLVFDPAGQFVREIGEQGGGPGEFNAPTGMTILPSGDLVVSDILRGFAVFGPNGAYKHQIPANESGGAIGPLRSDANGNLIARTGGFMMFQGGGPPPDGPPPQHVSRIALTPDSRKAETPTTSLHEIQRDPNTVRSTGRGDLRIMAPPTFAASFSWDALPDGGIAVAESTLYAVLIKDASGRLVRTITRNETPRRVTEADRQAAREQRRRMLSGEESGGGVRIAVTRNGDAPPQVSIGGGGRSMPPDMIEQQLVSMTFAEVMPMIRSITADRTGRLWVERTAGVGEDGPIDLITADGRYVGTVSGLRRPAAVNADGTLGAWVERDDLGVERVVVRRIPERWKP